MRRLALTLALLAAPAAAKPITVHVDGVVGQALIIAEVEILEVRTASWMGKDGGIRIRVSTDPRRIYKGARFCGTELDLTPFPAGPGRCTRELGIRRFRNETTLLVIDAKRVVHLVGERLEADYKVHGWCDFNACWLRCGDAALGKPLERHAVRVFTKTLRARYAGENAAFWALVAPHLCGAAQPLAAAELERLLAELAADARLRRERAHQLLLTRARYSLAALRGAEQRAEDPEQRRRIREVLDGLAEHARAAEVAELLTDTEARKWVVRAALPQLEGDARKKAERYLAQPDPDAQRDADDDEQND